jgi:hypothetical protein
MPCLTIPVPFDFTPAGKRRARVVPTSRGGQQLRWYVSGRRYHALPVTTAALALTREWVSNAGAPDHLPQPWDAFAE